MRNYVSGVQGVLTYPASPSEDENDGEEKQPETFTGNLQEGVREGSGKYTWPDGSTYEGEYKHGIRHGKGTIKFADGGMYTGTFCDGQLSGTGLMKYSNGDIYKGGFEKGHKEGQGCYHFAKYRCQFVGTFAAGAFKLGRWIHSDGSFINAAFENVEGQPQNCVPVGPATRFFARPQLTQKGEFQNSVWIGGEISAA